MGNESGDWIPATGHAFPVLMIYNRYNSGITGSVRRIKMVVL